MAKKAITTKGLNETLAALVETEPSITVVAYAIQSTGFGSAAEAWAAAPSTWTK